MRGVRTGWIRICAACLLSLAAAATRLDAQVASGEITGFVHDQAGAAVPGATVTVTDIATNIQRVVVSSDAGVYTAPSLGPGEYPHRRRAGRIQNHPPRRNPSVDGREGAHRFRPRDRQRQRTGHRRRRLADRARRNGEPRHRRRARAGAAAAAQRPCVHHSRRARPGRRAAAQLAAAAHQRRQAADQRVPVRRHFRAAAGARTSRLLPGDRRDPGIQDREQQPGGGVRPVQRRRRQPHHQVRRECGTWRRVRFSAQRVAECDQRTSS